jgi:hypothetical protein
MPKEKTYYIFKTNPKDTTCLKCLENDNRIFEEDDFPTLPVHQNCRCFSTKLKEMKISDSYVDTIEYREFYDNEANGKLLPESRGRYYMRVYTQRANSWIVYSNDGLVFYTYDNGETFNLASVSKNFIDLLDETKLIYPSKDYKYKYDEVLDKIPSPLFENDWSLEDKLAAIEDLVAELNVEDIYSWDNKVFSYAIDKGLFKNEKIKQDYCKEWIQAYSEVIKKAAEICDIPPVLIAGVAWIEVGGDPLIIDDLASIFRNNEKDFLTSFGNLSMQLRRVAEVLRIDIDSIDSKEKNSIKKVLKKISKNTQVQIFLAAQHLSDLKNIDFPSKTSDELTIEDIKVIASRYNIGPNYEYETVKKHDYGPRVEADLDLLLDLLN